MSKKIVKSLLILLIFQFSATAQEFYLGSKNKDFFYLNYKRGDYTKKNNDIVGTPYLEKDFRLGILYFEGKEPITVPMRYNIADEEIEVRIDGEDYLVKENISVKLEDGLYLKFPYNDKDISLVGDFKILTRDYQKKKLILLEKPTKRIKKGQEAAAMRLLTNDKFVDGLDYYLKFSDSEFAIFPETRGKLFISIFPSEHQEKVKNYIKSNNINPRKEKDLEKIVDYYNRSF